MDPCDLPIDRVLPDLVRTLRTSPAAVLTAPPGAGKTTRVPLALLQSRLVEGQLLLLQPRRLATRAVARMMAHTLGQPVGQTIGYRVRFEDCSSAATRILVVTEGILTRRLLVDPVLEGVGCVILDEFHERSIHADLALAFVHELLEVRDDLLLVVMSATLQAGPICRYLDDCPHLSIDTRQHPLTVEHQVPDAGALLPRIRRGERTVLGPAVRRALHHLITGPDDDGGDLLVFLPGVAEIRAVQLHLQQHPLPGSPVLVPLHGSLPAQEQDRALEPHATGRRVVLSTNIAQTSLTVPGITAVVDSGLAKQMTFDPGPGLERLELIHVSQDSATQRSGRAGRLGPGRAVRLWSLMDHAGLRHGDTPEILRCDLARVLLAVLYFRPADPARFEFFEAPALAGLKEAAGLLRLVGALPADGFALTVLGRRLALLPLAPRIGAVLDHAVQQGEGAVGAMLAALVSEREVLQRDSQRPTTDCDLNHRRELVLELERTGIAPSQLGLEPMAVRAVQQARDQLLASIPRQPAHDRGAAETSTGELLLAGFPDRVCRRASPGSDDALMVGGRGVRLARESCVRDAELFVAVQVEATRRGPHARSLVRLASAVTREALALTFPELLHREEQVAYDAQQDRVVGRQRLLFIDLVIDETSITVDPQQAALILARVAEPQLEVVLHPAAQLLARLRLAAVHQPDARWPDVSPPGLREWLPELCLGCHGLRALRRLDVSTRLLDRLDHRQRRLLDQLLPERIAVPSGRRVAVDYLADSGPVLAVKLQELFGLDDTPTLLQGRLPLTLHLLAPSGRPVQITRDLRSFWSEAYQQVRKDLRGRYPKHPWPEDPHSAAPTARTKRR